MERHSSSLKNGLFGTKLLSASVFRLDVGTACYYFCPTEITNSMKAAVTLPAPDVIW